MAENLPAVLEPAQDFYGHLIKVVKSRSSDDVFCTRFYTLNGFLCLEGVRRQGRVYADIDLTRVLRYQGGVSDKGSSFGVYRDSGNTPYCYHYENMTSMRTMPSKYLDDSSSYKDEDDAPMWARRDKQTAQGIANAKAVKDNQDTRERNREFLFKEVIPAYRSHIAREAYFDSWWRRFRYWANKKSGKFDEWVENYLSTHPDIDLMPLRRDIEKLKVEFDQEIDWMMPENPVGRKVTE